jgi:cysteinyl-tRNA synthetase
MYMSESLGRDRHRDQLERAQHARLARQAAELRRLVRIRQRAERRLLRAWQRADELRTTIEATG